MCIAWKLKGCYQPLPAKAVAVGPWKGCCWAKSSATSSRWMFLMFMAVLNAQEHHVFFIFLIFVHLSCHSKVKMQPPPKEATIFTLSNASMATWIQGCQVLDPTYCTFRNPAGVAKSSNHLSLSLSASEFPLQVLLAVANPGPAYRSRVGCWEYEHHIWSHVNRTPTVPCNCPQIQQNLTQVNLFMVGYPNPT